MQTGFSLARLCSPTLPLCISTVILIGVEMRLKVPIGILLKVGHTAFEVILNDIDWEFIGGDSISGMPLHYGSGLFIVIVSSTLSIESRLNPQRREWLHALERGVEGLGPFAGLVKLLLHTPTRGLRERKCIWKRNVVNDRRYFFLGLSIKLWFSLHLGGCYYYWNKNRNLCWYIIPNPSFLFPNLLYPINPILLHLKCLYKYYPFVLNGSIYTFH